MKALFLDFDGLICDTELAARRSWEELYQALGHRFPERVWRDMTGRPSGHRLAAADLGSRLGRSVTERELAFRQRRKQELADAEPLRPGVARLLADADARGLSLAAVSSSPAAWVRGHLDRLGVLARFHVVVTAEDVPRHKPEPDLYLHALAVTGLAPEDVLAIEDSPSGVTAARTAGLRCVAVPSTANGPAGLEHATLLIDTLADLDLDRV